MISRACESFGGYPSPGGAQDQEAELVETIQSMRYFAHVYEEMKRDPKTLTKDREKFMEEMERLSESVDR